MKEYHIFYAPDIEQTSCLPEEEAAHAVRVLRMQEGDELLCTDGRGTLYHCTITLCSKKACHLSIDERETWPRTWQSDIHLAIAPTKNMDRMEWLAEKATEMGLDRLTFLLTANSERTVVKTERIDKILVSAMKQSHKALKPELIGMTRFADLIAQPFEGQKFIAHCYDTDAPKPHLKDVCLPDVPTLILIGPEGDFSIEEVKAAEAAGFLAVSLGESRLRTETAGLVAVCTCGLMKSPRPAPPKGSASLRSCPPAAEMLTSDYE